MAYCQFHPSIQKNKKRVKFYRLFAISNTAFRPIYLRWNFKISSKFNLRPFSKQFYNSEATTHSVEILFGSVTWESVFSQTWLYRLRYVWLMPNGSNGITNPSVCRLSVWCLVTCVLHAPYSGDLTFRGYFCIVAWPSGNSPTKNHEDRPRRSLPTGALNASG